MKAVDCSNWTGPLTQETLAAWKADGVELIIVQAVDPPPGYPLGVTRQQIAACLEAGLAVDAYVWFWFERSLWPWDLDRKLALLDGLPIRQLWLDVEDTAPGYSPEQRAAAVSLALSRLDAYRTTSGQKAGVYTGRWYWTDYLADTPEFADRELWDADYDGIEDAEQSWEPYGGWTERAIKQWRGTSELAGMGGIDLNVLSPEEAAEVRGTPDQDEAVCQELVNALAYVCDNLGDQLRRARMTRRQRLAVADELRRVREQFLGPRP